MKTNKPLIYVVDDNEYMLVQLNRILKNSFSCDVRVFSDAETCLESVGEQKPDFILSDCNLSKDPLKHLSGEQMLFRIKERWDIPVIMYSSSNDAELAARLMKIGAMNFINSENVVYGKSFTSRMVESLKTELKNIQRQNNKLLNVIYSVLFIMFFLVLEYLIITYSPSIFLLVLLIFPFVISLYIILGKIKENKKEKEEVKSDNN